MKKKKERKKNSKNPRNQNPCHPLFSGGIICGSHRGSFAVRDHLRSNMGIICGLGIICGRGSFAALYRSLFSIRPTNTPTQRMTNFLNLACHAYACCAFRVRRLVKKHWQEIQLAFRRCHKNSLIILRGFRLGFKL